MGDTATQTQDTSTQEPAINTEPTENGQVVDYSEILARQQHELAKTGKTVQDLRSELAKSSEALGRVKKAFVGEDEQPLTPYQKRQAAYRELGAYIDEQALENQRAGGQGMPMTSRIGKQLVDLGLESEARAEKLTQELEELKQAMKRRDNPNFQGLERAAYIMEGMVDDALESLYGADAGSKQIRAAQFNAVTARINEEIKDLMKNDPQALQKVQRNPRIMRNMVNQFMAEMLPPKVRGMLDDERIKNEPMSQQQLWQAFAEAREQFEAAQASGDSRAEHMASQLMTEIRHDILAGQYGGKRDTGRPSLNQLFGGKIR